MTDEGIANADVMFIQGELNKFDFEFVTIAQNSIVLRDMYLRCGFFWDRA